MVLSALGQVPNRFYQNKQKTKSIINSDVQNTRAQNLKQTVTEMAKKDAANGEYMGAEFVQLRRACVSEVAPDRTAAILQASSMLDSNTWVDYEKELDRYIAMLFGLPYKAEASLPSGQDTAQIYDENGEMIAAYHWQSGWTAVSTSAENARSDELKFMYYDAYHAARNAMKSASGSGGDSPSLLNVTA